jgi:hypothetical protein
MAARTRLLALLVAPSLLLGACGQSGNDSAKGFQGDQKAVAQAVEDLQSAGRKRDASKICDDLLAPALVKRIEQSSSGTCSKALDQALQDADSFDLTVKKVAVTGTRATAVVVSDAGKKDRTDTLALERVGSNWKVAALGGSAG